MRDIPHTRAMALAVGCTLAVCLGMGCTPQDVDVVMRPTGAVTMDMTSGTTPTTPTDLPPDPPVPDEVGDDAFTDERSTARFLTQATFGPTREDIDSLRGTSASEWFQDQLELPPSLIVPQIDTYIEIQGGRGAETTNYAVWRNFIEGPDQLRQRMAYALSQILVVSSAAGGPLAERPRAVGRLQDHLIQSAFGNYRDVLELVTYSPAMGSYLTYMGNLKEDPTTGRAPNESYARELLQLFTVGLVELEPDGTPTLGDDGQPVELYDNTDITELARLFTGFRIDDPDGMDRWDLPMKIFWEGHDLGEKTFLGHTVPAHDGARNREAVIAYMRASISGALDAIFGHPNVGPLVGRQLIQRFVTSHPKPGYVRRVASAFDSGSFTLPNGDEVGTSRRGDLAATLAAVLFDPEARAEEARASVRFGKLREPVLRLTHWARAFDAPATNPEFFLPLWNGEVPWPYSQHPYQAPSVFNFYRPGYVPPGTLSGAAGMTVPELQTMGAVTIPGDANFLQWLVFRTREDFDREERLTAYFDFWQDQFGLQPDEETFRRSFVADYSGVRPLAPDTEALLDELDLILCAGSLSEPTMEELRTILEEVTEDEARLRLAIYLVMTSTDYIVQL